MTDTTQEEIGAAYAKLVGAIHAKDRPVIESLHDPDFQATELHGKLMTTDEHIEAIMQGGELKLHFYDLTTMRIADDLALAWGKQTLEGELRPEDINASVSEAVAKGILFALTGVWRKSGGQWRMLTYHCAEIIDD